jgi:hypothetical protein
VEKGAVQMDVFEQEAGAPGAVHEYNRGFGRPEQVQNAQLPIAFDTEENRLLQEMSMISGVSELSRQSQAPPGVKSGVALSIALEQDDTRLALTSGNVEQFMIQNGKQWLRMYKAFVPGVRTLSAIGRNNVVELMDWTGADIRSDDVIVEAFSALAESPAQRRQLVFDLMGTGIFNDPETGRITKETRTRLLEIIEMGNWETADDDDELHINKAERENKIMEAGGIAGVVDYDEHVLHISRHNKFRLTTDYEQVLAQNPQVDLLFQAHVGAHMQILANRMQAIQMTSALNNPQLPGLPATGGGDVGAA